MAEKDSKSSVGLPAGEPRPWPEADKGEAPTVNAGRIPVGRRPGTAEAGTASSPAPAPGMPSRIGPYRILDLLGKGGMGAVYLVEQTEPIRRRAALKLIRPGATDSETTLRFEAERQALARMNHPNIAQVFEAGATEEGQPYLVMEHVPGLPITTYCDNHRLDLRQRLKLFIAACEGVQHAHQKGILHRDLKPSNILVTESEDSPIPKIIDFGIARALDHQPLTEGMIFTGDRLIGTPAYLSPEAISPGEGGRDVDTRSDVYSLGVLLHELLVGALPFKGKNFLEVVRNISEQEPSKPSTRFMTQDRKARTKVARRREMDISARPLRGDLDWITMKAIARKRAERYGSATELADDVARHLRNEPVLASPPSTLYRINKFIRRHKAGVISALAVILALVGGIVGTTLEARRANSEARRANSEARRANSEAEVARQVSDLLVKLFEVSDPDEARGNSITARELLDVGAEKVERELAEQPLVQARLMDAIGTVYGQLGLYGQATPLLEKGLVIRQNLLEEDHLELAASLHNLAGLYYAQGDYERAEKLLLRALKIRETELGSDCREVAESLNSLVDVYRDRGEPERAEPRARRALAIQEKVLGADHPEVAVSLNDLAELYRDRGEYERAEPLFQRTLAIREKTLGEDHREVAESLNNLAELYRSQGRLERVEPLQRRALEIWEKVLGPDHPDVAASLYNLAIHYRAIGEYQRAEPLLQRAQQILEKALGPEHPHLAFILNSLADLRRVTGDYERADPLFRRALEIREAALGRRHPAVATSLHNLARLYRDRGEYQRAEPLFLRAVRILRETLGSEHPNLAFNLHNLALLYYHRGEPERAGPLLVQALGIREKALGPDHQVVADSLRRLADVYAAQDETEQARVLYDRCRASTERLLERSPANREARGRLAAILEGQGRLRRAQGDTGATESFHQALATIAPLAEDSEVVEYLEIHATALLRLGRVEEARPAVDKLLAKGWRQPGFLELCRRHGLRQ